MSDLDQSAMEESTVVVEAYKIKLRTRIGDLGEPAPASWNEVLRQVRGHLLRIAVAPTRLIVEVLEGATRFIRGITHVPASVAERIANAHKQADIVERTEQHAVVSGTAHTQLGATDAYARIIEILEKYQKEGRTAYLTVTAEGQLLVVLGTPPDGPESLGPAHEHLRLPEPASTDKP